MPDFLSCHYKLQLIATTAYIDFRKQNILLKTFLNSSNYRVITTTIKQKFHIPFLCASTAERFVIGENCKPKQKKIA